MDGKDERRPNVHYILTLDDGEEVYGIGTWSERHANYTAPLDKNTRRLTGCSMEYARIPMGRMTLVQARRRARTLWGYSKK